MTTSPLIEQQVHLEQLSSFCRRLLQVWNRPNGPEREAIAPLLSGRCIQCGLSVSGEELLEAAVGSNPSAKAVRLRQGYCARRGCNSFYYCVGLKSAAGVDWPNLLADAAVYDLTDVSEVNPDVVEAGPKLGRWRWAATGVALVFAVLGLLILRQWYLGGTIPFLREAERFETDRLAAEEVSY